LSAVRYALFALVLLAPSHALALDPDLGARGQVVFSDNLEAFATWTGFDDGTHRVSLGFGPSLDYFVARNVSIGADAFLGWQSARASNGNDSGSSARSRSREAAESSTAPRPR